jgi:hypothetical protein
MPAQFTEHPLADDRMLCRMVKDVHLPEAQQNFTCQQLGIKSGHWGGSPYITTVVNE